VSRTGPTGDGMLGVHAVVPSHVTVHTKWSLSLECTSSRRRELAIGSPARRALPLLVCTSRLPLLVTTTLVLCVLLQS
jgi:hypothetical protein